MVDEKLKGELIARALQSRLFERWRTQDSVSWQTTRRQFLIGTSAFGAVSVAGKLSMDGDPRVFRSGRKVVVTYRKTVWEIDPDFFGGSPVAWFKRESSGFVISLSHALLAGTDLPIDFVAKLGCPNADWHLHLSIPRIGFEGNAALGPWLNGETALSGDVSVSQIRLGDTLARLPGQVDLSIDSSLALAFVARSSAVTLSEPVSCSATRLLLRPALDTRESLHSHLSDDVTGPITRISLDNPHDVRPISLSPRKDRGAFSFNAHSVEACAGEVSGSTLNAASVWLLEARGALAMDGFGVNPGNCQSVQFERVALLIGGGRLDSLAAMAGRVSVAEHCLDVGHCIATVSGCDDSPFFARFDTGRVEPISIKAKLHRIVAPVIDAEVADVAFPGRPIDLVFLRGSESFAINRSRLLRGQQSNEAGASLIIIGREPVVLAPLDGATINVRRGVDLFNLTFGFEGFDLRVRHGNAIIRRRRPTKKKTDWPKGTVTVHFPPQHIAEEWFKVQDPSACMMNPPRFPTTARARLSGPSRIVFSVPGKVKDPKWVDRPLTIKALTEWGDLALSVNRRAAESDMSLDAQLDLSGITPDDHLEAALTKVAATFQPPTLGETSLEMTGRLLFSPARNAKWITPSRPINPSAALLWNARLDDVGRQSVRALWSRMMLPGTFGDPCEQKDILGGLPEEGESLLVLTAKDHRQIVTESSIYGLIALRRLVDKNGKENDSVDNAFKNLPKSRVIRPSKKPYTSLIEIDARKGLTNEDSGFALPTPFTDANVILTSIGGTLDADWHGEPPHIIIDEKRSDLKWPAPLSLERFAYRSQLGRDIRIDVQVKGYLVPLGHRATYVTLTERRFFKHPQFGYPVAHLVQRTFIVVSIPEKSFPAMYQPFNSRDFPADRVLMLTKTTPDLVPLSPSGSGVYSGPAKEDETGRVRVDGLNESIRVFWPRLSKGGLGSAGDFKFKWTVNSDEVPFVSNLLFVENDAVDSEKVMKGIAEYYRACNSTSRTAQASGSRRRYAPSEKAGDTSFDTDSWVLSARGRLMPASATGVDSGLQQEHEAFMMDGRMEGADQPPLYPYLERGRIAIQSLDRLVGSPQGLIDVNFNSVFVRTGFNTSENKSEIYLNVLGPDIKLDVTNTGNSTGGLAKPNTLVAALSRKIGLVGGLKKSEDQIKQQSALRSSENGVSSIITIPSVYASTPTPPPQDSPYDFTNAQKGTFDPKEFLGAIANTKLLGLIDLKEVLTALDIDGAPQLLEKIGYGAAGAADTALNGIKEIATKVLPDVQSTLKKFVDTVEKSFPAAVTFKDLYPVLEQRFSDFGKGLETAIPAIKKATNLGSIAESATGLATTGNALLVEVEHTLRDPIPQIIEADISALSASWEQLKSVVNGSYFDIGKRLRQEVVGKSVAAFCNEVGRAGLADLLFGVDKSVSCEDIVENPRAVLGRIDGSLFSQVFADPLANVLAYLRDYEAEVTGRIAWIRGTITSSILSIVQNAANQLSDRLVDDGVNVLEQRGQQKLAGLISASFDDVIAAALSPSSGETNVDTVNQMLDKVVKAAADFKSRIAPIIVQQQALFKPRQSVQLQSVIQAFQTQTVQAIAEVASALVRSKTDQVRSVLLSRIQETKAEAIQRLLGAVQRIVVAMANTALFASVAQVGTKLAHWCDASSTVVDFADDFAGGILGATMSPDILKIAESAQNITLPASAPSDVRDSFVKLRAAILVDAQQLAKTVKEIYDQADALHAFRQHTHSGTAFNACADIGAFLKPVAALLQSRRDALARANDLAVHTASLESLINQTQSLIADAKRGNVNAVSHYQVNALDPAVAQIAVYLGDIVKSTAAVLAGVTSIGQAGLTTTWSEIEGHISLIQSNSELAALPGYVKNLLDQKNALLSAASGFRTQFADPAITAAKLQTVATMVSSYAVENDKRLAAMVLQTVALPPTLSASLSKQIASSLSTTASMFVTLHQTCSGLLGTLLTMLNAPVVSQVLNPDVLSRFSNAKQEVDLDLQALQSIKNAGDDLGKALDSAQKLVKERWGITEVQTPPHQPPALVRAIGALADLVDHFLRGDLASLVRLPNVKEILEVVKEQVSRLVAQLLPTRVDLSYTWKTGLGDAPSGDPIFKLTAGKSPDDLVIDAHVSIDFISSTRSALLSGTLKPFEIHLIGKIADIVTIKFNGASFKSRDGSAPEFSADINDVTLGPVLQFLKPLQEWMSPSSGSGAYVKPITLGGTAGIEAGYVYDAGLIQVGTLQFINVALGVGARLPFGNQPAELVFTFASPERPFLIAQPPYGGGGYLRLISNSQDITDFALSFVFGAVVAIKFGPLKAHGRVTAGIFIETGTGHREIRAFIEAVGEGNIACFSICVSIQVGLKHDEKSGTLSGYSIYSISFKVGFVSLTFSFKASYTIHGGSGSSGSGNSMQSQLLQRPFEPFVQTEGPATHYPQLYPAAYHPGEIAKEWASAQAGEALGGGGDRVLKYCEEVDTCVKPADKSARRISIRVPRRASEWSKYQKRISMDLLRN